MMLGKLQRAHCTLLGHFAPAYLDGSNKLRAYLFFIYEWDSTYNLQPFAEKSVWGGDTFLAVSKVQFVLKLLFCIPGLLWLEFAGLFIAQFGALLTRGRPYIHVTWFRFCHINDICFQVIEYLIWQQIINFMDIKCGMWIMQAGSIQH